MPRLRGARAHVVDRGVRMSAPLRHCAAWILSSLLVVGLAPRRRRRCAHRRLVARTSQSEASTTPSWPRLGTPAALDRSAPSRQPTGPDSRPTQPRRTRLAGLREQLAAARTSTASSWSAPRLERGARTRREAARARCCRRSPRCKETLRAMQAKVTELETQRSQQHGELAQQLQDRRRVRRAAARHRRVARVRAAHQQHPRRLGRDAAAQRRRGGRAASSASTSTCSRASRSDAGAGRPDMVVHLPGGKNIAVDAKVPFNSYLEASAIPATATDAELARNATRCSSSTSRRCATTSTRSARKAYWDGPRRPAPRWSIAFIPSESLRLRGARGRPVDHGVRVQQARRARLARHPVVGAQDGRVQLAAGRAHRGGEDALRPQPGAVRPPRRHWPGTSTSCGRSIERSVKDYNAFVGLARAPGAADGPQAQAARRVEGAGPARPRSRRRSVSSPRLNSPRSSSRGSDLQMSRSARRELAEVDDEMALRARGHSGADCRRRSHRRNRCAPTPRSSTPLRPHPASSTRSPSARPSGPAHRVGLTGDRSAGAHVPNRACTEQRTYRTADQVYRTADESPEAPTKSA